MRLLSLKENQSFLEKYLDIALEYSKELDPEQQGRMQDDAWIKEHRHMLKERLYDSNCEIFLFQKDTDCVGFAEVTLEERCFPDEDLPENCMRVYVFYITQPFRKQMLGTHFFKLLRAWGREKRAALVEMEVPEWCKDGIEFLEKQGLEVQGHGKVELLRAFI